MASRRPKEPVEAWEWDVISLRYLYEMDVSKALPKKYWNAFLCGFYRGGGCLACFMYPEASQCGMLARHLYDELEYSNDLYLLSKT